MNTLTFPVVAPLPLNSSNAATPEQQAAVGTKNTPGQNYPADSAAAQKSDDAHLNSEKTSESSVRVKRGFKLSGFRGGFRQNSNKLPSAGVPGKFTPKPKPSAGPIGTKLSPGPTGGPANTPGVSNFRNLVFKTQHPTSALSGPPKAVVAQPKTFGDVANNLVAADRLVKAGVFKTDTPLKTVVRDAVVNASINGIISTPLSVGTYAGSVWSGETIKGHFTANTPLLPPAHQPAPSQQGNGAVATGSVAGAQEAATFTLHLDNAELKFLLAVNTIQTLVEGGDANALGKHPNWPTGTKERLENLEKLYDATEKNLAAFAEQNEFIFKPHVADSSSGSKSDAERLSELEKRNEKINKGISRFIAVRSLETENKEQVV